MAVLALVSELLTRSQMVAAAQRAEVDLEVCATGAALIERAQTAKPDLVLLDLAQPLLDLPTTVQALKSAGAAPTIIAFGPHVHADRLRAATAAGCDLVISRGQFHAQAVDLLARFGR